MNSYMYQHPYNESITDSGFFFYFWTWFTVCIFFLSHTQLIHMTLKTIGCPTNLNAWPICVLAWLNASIRFECLTLLFKKPSKNQHFVTSLQIEKNIYSFSSLVLVMMKCKWVGFINIINFLTVAISYLEILQEPILATC